MSFTTILAINLAVLGMVLWNDLGTKAVTGKRLRRPLITTILVGSSVFEAIPKGGNSELLVALGIGSGALLGLLASALLRVDHSHEDGIARTVGGTGYAALWIAVIGGRIVFSYGADHWFSGSLTSFCIQHQLTAASITDALVGMALAMVLSRTAVLAARVHLGQATTGAGAHAAV